METKTCEICGQSKPISEFSKSYRNSCRECVAEQTRNARHAKSTESNECSDITVRPRINADIAELQLVQTAIAALIKKIDGRVMNYDCIEIGQQAVKIAHTALSMMRCTNE